MSDLNPIRLSEGSGYAIEGNDVFIQGWDL